jgi:hypothetical protein
VLLNKKPTWRSSSGSSGGLIEGDRFYVSVRNHWFYRMCHGRVACSLGELELF